MFDRNKTIGDFVDAIVIHELKHAADIHNHCSMCEADTKHNKKVIKKARWLLKNWYMSSDEWSAYDV